MRFGGVCVGIDSTLALPLGEAHKPLDRKWAIERFVDAQLFA
jgi:hypothetical protein